MGTAIRSLNSTKTADPNPIIPEALDRDTSV